MSIKTFISRVVHVITVAALFIAVTGCSSIQPTPPLQVTTVKTVAVKIPDPLLTPCVPVKPLAVEQYIQLNPTQREEYMSDYVVDLLGLVATCNQKLAKIKELSRESQP